MAKKRFKSEMFKTMLRQARAKIKIWVVQNGHDLKGKNMATLYRLYFDDLGISVPQTKDDADTFVVHYFNPWYEGSKYAPPKIKTKTLHETDSWQFLKNIINRFYPAVCMKCGVKGVELHVDHIKPKSLYPMLAYELDNLQRLCKDCNFAKSNLEEIDYRPKELREKFLKYIHRKNVK
jgi:5-methylcytosine-specific restriction endonuclease McrA